MQCKRCNAPLPGSGYVCTRCGAMMSTEQIEEQKENLKQNSYYKTELVSEKYGGKQQIFEGRREENTSIKLLILLFGILLFLIILIALGLFLLK